MEDSPTSKIHDWTVRGMRMKTLLCEALRFRNAFAAASLTTLLIQD